MTPQELRKEYQRIAKSGGIISPGPTDVHVNRPLTNISIAFALDVGMYVADRVFPDVPVMKQSDVYFTIPRGAFLRDDMQQRAPGTESAGADYSFDQDDYRCATWALHKNIDDETRANYDSPLSTDRTATRFLMEKGLIRKERLFSENYLKDAVWTFKVSGAAARSANPDYLAASNNEVINWANAMSTPIEDMRLFCRIMLARTGKKPNVLVIGKAAYDVLLDHPDIVARIDRGQTPGGPALSNREALAAIFELEEILVMEGIYNSAQEGAADALGFVNEDNALLAYRTMTPALEEATAGYTFSWAARVGAANMGTRIKRMRIETHESDRIEIQMAFVQKVVAADLGFWMKGIIQ